MFPIEIEVQLSVSSADSDLQDFLQTQPFFYQRDYQPRRYRKKPQSDLQQYLNSKVPGRQRQISQVAKFISNLRLGDKTPLCLHGSTGCGKTSIITETLNYLRQHNEQFQTLYINCLNFTSIKKIYTVMLKQLFGGRDKNPQSCLSTIFTNKEHRNNEQQIKLVVFDQIDQYSNNKSFIYNILEWVQASIFPFGVILISNMVNFSSNLERKSQSRIKFNSIIFTHYNFQELIEIVKHKFSNTIKKFDESAIIFLCKKVEGINSDVRLLERYYNKALEQHKKTREKVHIKDIQALFISQQNGIHEIVKPYKFILQILYRSSAMENIATDIQHYCLANNRSQYKENQVLYMLGDLQQMGVIKISRDPNKTCHYYYNSWGIDMEQLGFKLQETKFQN